MSSREEAGTPQDEAVRRLERNVMTRRWTDDLIRG